MNGDLNASVTRLDEPLVGPAGGPLTGRTMLVEDLIDTAGIRTTYGSRLYATTSRSGTRPSSSGCSTPE